MARVPYLASGNDEDGANNGRRRAVADVLMNSDLHIFRALANAPGLLPGFAALGASLISGSLPPRIREMVICRIAAMLGSDYEWSHHAALAGAAGVTGAELEAIAHGATTTLPARDAIAVRFAEAVEARTLGDDLWAQAEAEFDTAQLVELAALTGFYGMASRFTIALSLDLDDDTVAVDRAPS